jgi:hypothetical protein
MQCQASNRKMRRCFLPNTAFKMIGEIQAAGAKNTTMFASRDGMMPATQLSLKCQSDHVDRSKCRLARKMLPHEGDGCPRMRTPLNLSAYWQ